MLYVMAVVVVVVVTFVRSVKCKFLKKIKNHIARKNIVFETATCLAILVCDEAHPQKPSLPFVAWQTMKRALPIRATAVEPTFLKPRARL